MSGLIRLRGCCEDYKAARLGPSLKSERETEGQKDGGSKKSRKEQGRERRVTEERQEDFTVFLTGRPEGHTYTESALCVCVLSEWLYGGG